MVARFTTIGHSTRSPDEFLAMLREAGVAELVDIRSFPHSRTHPAFNREALPGLLARAAIRYRHCPALGGRRGRVPGVDPALNAGWRHPSFHNYADYALGAEFAASLAGLRRLGHDHRIALMCAEAVWWRCHRRIVTDYLLFAGEPVDHLIAPGRIEHARPTPWAVAAPDGRVLYPA